MRIVTLWFATALVASAAGCAATSAGPGAELLNAPSQEAPIAAPSRVEPAVAPPPLMSASIEELSKLQSPAPSRLVIPGIGVDMTIDAVGLAADMTMEIPASAAVAGWYQYGRAPASERGNTVVAAHVDDAQRGLGPFAKLKELTPGSEVQVTDAAGDTHVFMVTAVEQTAKTTVDSALLFSREGPQRLVLVTCGGRWNSSIGHYEDNIIVWAEPIEVAS